MKDDELGMKDEEQSSTTEPTVQEITPCEQKTDKDTDEDASFSENEQISTRSWKSDEQQTSLNTLETTEESHPSFPISANEKQDDHEIMSCTTESSINRMNILESQLQSMYSVIKQLETTMDQEVKF